MYSSLKQLNTDESFDVEAFLKYFVECSIVSWNVSGIAECDQDAFVGNLSIASDLKIAFIHEFNNSMNTYQFDAGAARVYVSPGITSASRSNAICIHQSLVPYVFDQVSCPIAMIVLDKLANLSWRC